MNLLKSISIKNKKKEFFLKKQIIYLMNSILFLMVFFDFII